MTIYYKIKNTGIDLFISYHPKVIQLKREAKNKIKTTGNCSKNYTLIKSWWSRNKNIDANRRSAPSLKKLKRSRNNNKNK